MTLSASYIFTAVGNDNRQVTVFINDSLNHSLSSKIGTKRHCCVCCSETRRLIFFDFFWKVGGERRKYTQVSGNIRSKFVSCSLTF